MNMKNLPLHLKIISFTSLLSAIAGLVVAFKFPGTLAMAPLTIAVLLGLWSIILVLKNKYKCYAGFIALALAIVGIVIVLFVKPAKVEVAKDVQQDIEMEQSHEEALEGLDDALDELE